MSRIPFGQPIELCPSLDANQAPSHDKWALLTALTEAAEHFGLNHRTLTVLRALLSFYPERDLPATPGLAVVYPSNRTLSERLNGMPESTLRRHLARLVDLGIVRRQDSANRKRFARARGLAFGFDLSPLAQNAQDLAEAAHQARAERAEIAALRAHLAALRQQLIEADPCPTQTALIEETRLMLRRKLPIRELNNQISKLQSHLDNPGIAPVPTTEMNATDSENGRHIQYTDDSNYVTKNDSQENRNTQAPPLPKVLAVCQEYQCFFPQAPRNWDTLVKLAGQLYAMIGVDRASFAEANHQVGQRGTAVIILCMLEKLGTIRSPGAYLRGLCKRAEQGRLNLSGMLRALEAEKLSADNFVSDHCPAP